MVGSVVLPSLVAPSVHPSTPLSPGAAQAQASPTPKQTRSQCPSSYLSSHTFRMHGALGLPNRSVCHIDHTTSLAAMPYRPWNWLTTYTVPLYSWLHIVVVGITLAE
jgi:hypothetical protein